MTWVCAASTVYGYGAHYSDVQVTFKGGRTADVLQKAYPLGKNIAAGFAGSVRIGFELLESLSYGLSLPAHVYEKWGWEPKWVSERWAPDAKKIFDRAPKEERDLGSAVLMVGADPKQNCGFGAKIYFTRFSWDQGFRPCIMSRAIKFCSIGTGARTPGYHRSLKPLLRLSSGMMKAEVMNPGGWGTNFGYSISNRLADHPYEGISRYIHMLIVRRDGVVTTTNDENIYPPNDGPCNQIRMPPVATSYPEFEALARAAGHEAGGAVC